MLVQQFVSLQKNVSMFLRQVLSCELICPTKQDLVGIKWIH
jgi:hypothetical protein